MICRPFPRRRSRQILALALVSSALLAPASSKARSQLDLDNLSVQVVDGDTLKIEGSTHRIRLFGVDACESGQLAETASGQKVDCGKPAHQMLSEWTQGQAVRCQVRDYDIYERAVARCGTQYVPDFSAELIRQGLAVAYRYRGRVAWKPYEQIERQAKQQKRGVWAWKFDQPWIYRQTEKKRR